jgi:cytochrome P450/NADPH-cytochrome P450 reductase
MIEFKKTVENTAGETAKAELLKRLKPFGNGVRACLGKNFAMQQAKLVIAALFLRFDFKLVDPLYQLRHKQRIALQPDGFKITATLRTEKDTSSPSTVSSSASPEASSSSKPESPSPESPNPEPPKPIYILWGGQNGTCETYAQTLSQWAPAYS